MRHLDLRPKNLENRLLLRFLERNSEETLPRTCFACGYSACSVQINILAYGLPRGSIMLQVRVPVGHKRLGTVAGTSRLWREAVSEQHKCNLLVSLVSIHAVCSDVLCADYHAARSCIQKVHDWKVKAKTYCMLQQQRNYIIIADFKPWPWPSYGINEHIP